MKRMTLAAIAAACMLLFCSCGGSVDLSAVEQAVAAPPAAADSKFTLNMVFGEQKATLLFSMGSFSADYEGSTLSAKMTRTLLGTASAVELEYDGENCTTKIDGESHTSPMSPEQLFGSLIYAHPVLPSEQQRSSSSLSADGLYTVSCKTPDSELLFGLVGEDIYEIAEIYVPKKDKMYCENAVFTYRLKDGMITDYSLDFTLHLFETPPYVPGIKVDESDYELVLEVSFTASYSHG